MYSLYDFRVGRLGTALELYTVRPYGLKDSFIHKQLVFNGQLRFWSDKPIDVTIAAVE